jgi:hypothetical protein
MYNTFDTYQAEIEYRGNRIRKDTGRPGRRIRRHLVRRQGHVLRAS